jgi:hypothetical protein
MGLEVTTIRRRLSTAAGQAARMGQIGEGSGLAGKRHAWHKLEERHMLLQQEGDWLVVRRGRFWGR